MMDNVQRNSLLFGQSGVAKLALVPVMRNNLTCTRMANAGME